MIDKLTVKDISQAKGHGGKIPLVVSNGKNQDPNWAYFSSCSKNCKNSKTFSADLGYKDNYRGWYDINNCGECNAYCRWVGNNGSGGDPSTKQNMEVLGGLVLLVMKLIVNLVILEKNLILKSVAINGKI